MTTAREICTDSIKESGALGVGQTALAEDINDAFTRLQRMVAQWQKKRWLVPSLQEIFFTATGAKSYTVGIGGDINIQRPSDIKGGYMIQLNTGSTPISLPLEKIFSFEEYIRITVKNLTSLPDHFFYDGQYPLAHLYPWPIPNSLYELHFILESLLGFGTTISAGSITHGGTLYTAGIYNTVALTGGTGTGAIGDFTVTGGAVTLLGLSAGGQGYAIGDVLGVNAADVGGTGSGFAYTVNNINANLDTEIVMPPEYEEALMYNLALRCCSMYQIEPIGQTLRLAKSTLNTLRTANTQVPKLTMPNAPGVKVGKAFNIFNSEGYIFLLGFLPAIEMANKISAFIC